jgi:N4-(beta-N-acetylglucosaminyl)-L-asparaginase
MRQGKTPMEACKEAIARLAKKCGEEVKGDVQVGIIAVNKKGVVAAFSLKKGFEYAVTSQGINEIKEAEYLLDIQFNYKHL